jgi:branched-chain amino acid transport system ATP-binding protein
MNLSLLEIKNLRVAYGGIQAVKGVSFEVREGQLVCLIGANGAGKSTTLKTIAGLLSSSADAMIYQGRSIQGMKAWDVAKLGLVMVPEGRGTFTRISVTENLQMGAFLRSDADIASDIDKVFVLFPQLQTRRHQLAGTLSGGEQQMLAMGRAIMARPKLLLLDEPSMGLSPVMVDKIFEIIGSIAKQGMSILLIEQNAHRALALADHAYVMESGEITLSGPAKKMLFDPKVQVAYLGG